MSDTVTDPAGLGPALDDAVAAAGPLAALSPHRRAELCEAIADDLDRHVEDIVAVADAETSLGAVRLTGELGRTTGQWRDYGRAGLDGQVWDVTVDHATDGRPDIRRMNRPVGPVAVYAASNFPLAFSVAGTDTAAALAVGCPVVAKAHEGHPLTSALVGGIVSEALVRKGLPPGCFTVVYGFDTGVALISRPEIKAAAFTGSPRGGRALFDAAAARPEPIPFYGELGSLNPVVVTRAAAAEHGAALVAGFTASFTLGSGQYCTKPGLLLLPDGHRLTESLGAAVRATRTHPLLHDGIATGFATGTAALAAHPDVTTVVEPSLSGREVTAGLYATTAAALSNDPDTLLAECFGPVSLLATYRDDAELDRVLAGLPGGLTGAVHTAGTGDDQAGPVLARLADRCGRVIVDQWPTGVAVTWAMHHGGPFPATTAAGHTSVGPAALRRFVRPVSFQNVPAGLLPEALVDDARWPAQRRIDGRLQF